MLGPPHSPLIIDGHRIHYTHGSLERRAAATSTRDSRSMSNLVVEQWYMHVCVYTHVQRERETERESVNTTISCESRVVANESILELALRDHYCCYR